LWWQVWWFLLLLLLLQELAVAERMTVVKQLLWREFVGTEHMMPVGNRSNRTWMD
jgi:hypothetical protein